MDFTYDALSRLVSVDRYSDLAGTQPVVASTVEYDNLSRLTSLVHNNGTADVAFYRLSFDAARRIAEIVDADCTRRFTYDDQDQLVGVAYSNAALPDEVFSYDANGNRTGGGYVVGAANRLLNDGVFEYTYDNEGNMSRRREVATGRTREFTWDYRNRLIEMTDRDAVGTATQVVRFAYDAVDRRIAKAVDTTPQDVVDAVLTHFEIGRAHV